MTDAFDFDGLISVDRVLALHRLSYEKYGGDGTTRATDRDCISAALGAAWNAALYREPEDAVRGLSFMAFAMVYIARRHCFVDGNKRVSWLTAVEICQAKRLTIDATADEAEELMTSVVTESQDPDQVVVWIAERLVWIH